MTINEALEAIYDEWEELTRFINPLESWSVFLRRRLGEIGYIITRPQGWP